MRASDPNFPKKVEKLYKLTLYCRWIIIICSWLTFGLYGIWGLRKEISLWLDYFTWVAVRYGLAFNLLPTLCLSICLWLTVSTLYWQIKNKYWGLSRRDKRDLEKQVKKILAKGKKHPLYKFIN